MNPGQLLEMLWSAMEMPWKFPGFCLEQTPTNTREKIRETRKNATTQRTSKSAKFRWIFSGRKFRGIPWSCHGHLPDMFAAITRERQYITPKTRIGVWGRGGSIWRREGCAWEGRWEEVWAGGGRLVLISLRSYCSQKPGVRLAYNFENMVQSILQLICFFRGWPAVIGFG